MNERRCSTLILMMFLGSGCAALIYEIVWLHLLRLIVGSSTASLGILLACFMGGMSLGSLLLPRLISSDWNPFRIYAVIEIFIGVIGLLLVYLSSNVHTLYMWLATHGLAGGGAKLFIAVIFLMPPTILMGATLPAIARSVRADTQGAARLGYYYGANIIGAVCGCLLAGFVLLQYYDVLTATFVAVSINFMVAMVAFRLSYIGERHHISSATVKINHLSGLDSQTHSKESHNHQRSPVPLIWVCLIVCLSGASALGAEVVWTRLLSLILGGTVYTFAILLAVFLAGLGLGGGLGGVLATRLRLPLLGLGVLQLLTVVTITHASTQFQLTYENTHPLWEWVSTNLPTRLQDALLALWVVGPSALCWGASFPLAITATIDASQDTGRSVGVLGASNTFGAILGALGASFWILPTYGTQWAQIILVVISILAAALALGYELRRWILNGRSPQRIKPWYRMPGLHILLLSAMCIVFCGFCLMRVPPVSSQLLAHGSHRVDYLRHGEVLYRAEGVHSPVLVKRFMDEQKTLSLHISGKLVASTGLVEMRLQRMLGHVPQVLHPRPRSVLIIGLGTGVTAGTFVVDPRIETITICEIEPRVYRAAKEYFSSENERVLDDPRTRIVFDDARHFLATTDQKYDIIASDPIHPWVRGAASLYSQEFYDICRARLNPGGIVAHWLPLNGMNIAAVKSEVVTFFHAFPRCTLWHTGDLPNQRHMIICGSMDPGPIDLNRVNELIETAPGFKRSLARLNMQSLSDLLELYTTQKSDLAPWLSDAQINRDWAMRLEYLAGHAYSDMRAEEIYGEITPFRVFPEDLFQGDGLILDDLRERFLENLSD